MIVPDLDDCAGPAKLCRTLMIVPDLAQYFLPDLGEYFLPDLEEYFLPDQALYEYFLPDLDNYLCRTFRFRTLCKTSGERKVRHTIVCTT